MNIYTTNQHTSPRPLLCTYIFLQVSLNERSPLTTYNMVIFHNYAWEFTIQFIPTKTDRWQIISIIPLNYLSTYWYHWFRIISRSGCRYVRFSYILSTWYPQDCMCTRLLKNSGLCPSFFIVLVNLYIFWIKNSRPRNTL